MKQLITMTKQEIIDNAHTLNILIDKIRKHKYDHLRPTDKIVTYINGNLGYVEGKENTDLTGCIVREGKVYLEKK